MENLPLELRKLGLRKKEVDVYLAGLELGPTSVKKIAEQAGISRPTTYNIIEDLEQQELFTEQKQDKEKYYVAQSPDHLLGVLRTKKKELEEKEREFVRIISALKSKYFSEGKGEIKTYQGEAGLKALEEELSFTPSSEIFVLSSKTNSEPIKTREEIYQEIKKRLGEIKIKEIYPSPVKAEQSWLERKSYSLPNLEGTLILTDKVIFYPTPQKAMVIENKLIVNLFRSIFLAWWDSI